MSYLNFKGTWKCTIKYNKMWVEYKYAYINKHFGVAQGSVRDTEIVGFFCWTG